MIAKIYYLLFLVAFASTSIPLVNGFEDTKIAVSLVGNSIIDMTSAERLIRAYVDVTNFDPSEGSYIMQIIQSSTGITISEQEILIRETGNGKAGVNVAYLVNEDDLNINGSKIEGSYEILVKSQMGNSIASTNFSITESGGFIPPNFEVENTSENNETDVPLVQLNENLVFDDSDSDLQDESLVGLNSENSKTDEIQVPKWIRNIFILYADGSISDLELLNAIKFLVEQEIIVI